MDKSSFDALFDDTARAADRLAGFAEPMRYVPPGGVFDPEADPVAVIVDEADGSVDTGIPGAGRTRTGSIMATVWKIEMPVPPVRGGVFHRASGARLKIMQAPASLNSGEWGLELTPA
ncbi:hypothetical protein FKB34_01825 [Glycocaulis profundi]|nr:hypothetical protein FKB34_01825 [Glycocaulis profundi]